MLQCCSRCVRRHSGHRLRCGTVAGADEGGSGRAPLRGAVAGTIAAAVRGVGVAPGRGTLMADLTAGVGVAAISTSILICMKKLE